MAKKTTDEMNRKSVTEFKEAAKTPLILILNDIRSLHNIGSFFRTADAFLIEKIYLCGITATPPNKEINKTALGATETVAWEYRDDIVALVHELKQAGIQILSVEQTHQAIWLHEVEAVKNVRYALVFGHEVFGVHPDVIALSDQCIEIPQLGTKHSLNVAVSGGIAVWEFYKKLAALQN
ncbi:MAG: RNA methyltransferase [Flavobacterium sp. BFFFF2]|nr:MAG: RNA methyltransferase [Flavobacterium sp. BFFFF2]